MLELLPTLFAQQQLKQAVTPIPQIEPSSQTQFNHAALVITPTSAIATPESVFVPVSATPAPVVVEVTPAPATPTAPLTPPTVSTQATSPQPNLVSRPAVSSSDSQAATLPQAPVIAPLNASQATDSLSKPVASKQTPTALAKPSAKPTSSILPASPTPQAATSKSNTASQFDRSATSIEIPVPKPDAPATPQSPTLQSPILQQKQLLEQRLADIVAKDRVIKQAQQRDTLVSRAYSLATQRRFEQARKLLQDPAVPVDVRTQILSNIDSLESASRTIGVTQIKEPAAKPTRPVVAARKLPAVVSSHAPQPVSSTQIARSQQITTIQVPRAIESLPIQRKSLVNDPTVASGSDSTGGYIDQIVTPKNLQAYNRNLPKLNSKDQILYPLPESVPVTSGFGWRRHPVTGVRRFHSGVDLGAGQGTPVIASRSGKVTVADQMGGYGLAIVLEQSNGSQDTLYAHLSQIFVRPGDKIQPGTIIGRVGSTGLSTGPHLHYEARRMTNSGWTAVDPGGQLEAARVRLVQARQINARQSAPDAGS